MPLTRKQQAKKFRTGAVQGTAARASANRAIASFARQNAAAARRHLTRLGGRMPATSMELKDKTVLTTAVIAIGTATAFSPFLLNGIAQGTTASTRLGRRITMKSLLLRASFGMAPTTTGGSPIRILIVYDSQTNATAPVATDVVLTDEISSPMNLGNSRRFKTILDEIIPCIGTGGPQSMHVTRYVKLNHQVEFNAGSAGTVGDIQTGSVYCLIWQNGRILVAAPTADIYTRIRYSDN